MILFVWVVALLGGMALRVAAGGSTAPGFVAVAGITLAFFLVGWRALARQSTRKTASLRR